MCKLHMQRISVVHIGLQNSYFFIWIIYKKYSWRDDIYINQFYCCTFGNIHIHKYCAVLKCIYDYDEGCVLTALRSRQSAFENGA